MAKRNRGNATDTEGVKMKSLASMQARRHEIIQELETTTDIIYAKVLRKEYQELTEQVNNWGTQSGQVYRIM